MNSGQSSMEILLGCLRSSDTAVHYPALQKLLSLSQRTDIPTLKLLTSSTAEIERIYYESSLIERDRKFLADILSYIFVITDIEKSFLYRLHGDLVPYDSLGYQYTRKMLGYLVTKKNAKFRLAVSDLERSVIHNLIYSGCSFLLNTNCEADCVDFLFELKCERFLPFLVTPPVYSKVIAYVSDLCFYKDLSAVLLNVCLHQKDFVMFVRYFLRFYACRVPNEMEVRHLLANHLDLVEIVEGSEDISFESKFEDLRSVPAKRKDTGSENLTGFAKTDTQKSDEVDFKTDSSVSGNLRDCSKADIQKSERDDLKTNNSASENLKDFSKTDIGKTNMGNDSKTNSNGDDITRNSDDISGNVDKSISDVLPETARHLIESRLIFDFNEYEKRVIQNADNLSKSEIIDRIAADFRARTLTAIQAASLIKKVRIPTPEPIISETSKEVLEETVEEKEPNESVKEVVINTSAGSLLLSSTKKSADDMPDELFIDSFFVHASISALKYVPYSSIHASNLLAYENAAISTHIPDSPKENSHSKLMEELRNCSTSSFHSTDGMKSPGKFIFCDFEGLNMSVVIDFALRNCTYQEFLQILLVVGESKSMLFDENYLRDLVTLRKSQHDANLMSYSKNVVDSANHLRDSDKSRHLTASNSPNGKNTDCAKVVNPWNIDNVLRVANNSLKEILSDYLHTDLQITDPIPIENFMKVTSRLERDVESKRFASYAVSNAFCHYGFGRDAVFYDGLPYDLSFDTIFSCSKIDLLSLVSSLGAIRCNAGFQTVDCSEQVGQLNRMLEEAVWSSEVSYKRVGAILAYSMSAGYYGSSKDYILQKGELRDNKGETRDNNQETRDTRGESNQDVSSGCILQKGELRDIKEEIRDINPNPNPECLNPNPNPSPNPNPELITKEFLINNPDIQESLFQEITTRETIPPTYFRTSELPVTDIVEDDFAHNLFAVLGELLPHANCRFMSVAGLLSALFLYSDTQPTCSFVREALMPLLYKESIETVGFCCFVLGALYCGTADIELQNYFLSIYTERSETDSESVFFLLIVLGASLIFLNRPDLANCAYFDNFGNYRHIFTAMAYVGSSQKEIVAFFLDELSRFEEIENEDNKNSEQGEQYSVRNSTNTARSKNTTENEQFGMADQYTARNNSNVTNPIEMDQSTTADQPAPRNISNYVGDSPVPVPASSQNYSTENQGASLSVNLNYVNSDIPLLDDSLISHLIPSESLGQKQTSISDPSGVSNYNPNQSTPQSTSNSISDPSGISNHKLNPNISKKISMITKSAQSHPVNKEAYFESLKSDKRSDFILKRLSFISKKQEEVRKAKSHGIKSLQTDSLTVDSLSNSDSLESFSSCSSYDSFNESWLDENLDSAQKDRIMTDLLSAFNKIENNVRATSSNTKSKAHNGSTSDLHITDPSACDHNTCDLSRCDHNSGNPNIADLNTADHTSNDWTCNNDILQARKGLNLPECRRIIIHEDGLSEDSQYTSSESESVCISAREIPFKERLTVLPAENYGDNQSREMKITLSPITADKSSVFEVKHIPSESQSNSNQIGQSPRDLSSVFKFNHTPSQRNNESGQSTMLQIPLSTSNYARFKSYEKSVGNYGNKPSKGYTMPLYDRISKRKYSNDHGNANQSSTGHTLPFSHDMPGQKCSNDHGNANRSLNGHTVPFSREMSGEEHGQNNNDSSKEREEDKSSNDTQASTTPFLGDVSKESANSMSGDLHPQNNDSNDDKQPETLETHAKAMLLLAITLLALNDQPTRNICKSMFMNLIGKDTTNILPLLLGVLFASNPDTEIIDCLSRTINTNEPATSIMGLSLIGAGTNNTRIVKIIEAQYGYHSKASKIMHLGQVASGIIHLGKGTLAISPLYNRGTSINKRALISLSAFTILFMGNQTPIISKWNFLFYLLIPAIKNKYLITMDQDLNFMSQNIRIGRPSNINPENLTGITMQESPVIVQEDERAEIPDEIDLKGIAEGVVIISHNKNNLQ